MQNATRPQPPKEKKRMGRPRTMDEPRPTKKGPKKPEAGSSQRNVEAEGNTGSSQRKGKGIMYDDVEAEMHEVDVETDFHMHAAARDLLQSGYSETEVLDAMNEQEIRIEQIP
ncbi:hypothetical protein LXL04_029552 [Taraxacum kok-saghyz]